MSERKLVNPANFLAEGEKPVEYEIQHDELVKKKNPEDKKYLLIYLYNDPDSKDDKKSWEEITGKRNAYDFIKNMIEYIDIHESKILAENIEYKDIATVYEFMKVMAELYQDDFNIEDYNVE